MFEDFRQDLLTSPNINRTESTRKYTKVGIQIF